MSTSKDQTLASPDSASMEERTWLGGPTPIAYDLTGPTSALPAKTPLLFIHGLNSARSAWKKQVEHFSEFRTVVSVDMRGHGGSGKPKSGYSIKDYAADIAGLIAELDLGPIHLVGTSLGGMVAQSIAVSEPGFLKTLSLVGTAYEMPALGMEELASDILARGTRAVLEPFVDANTFAPGAPAELVDYVMDIIANESDELAAQRWREASFDGVEAATRIACPTLVIHGDRDLTVPLASAVATYAAVKDSELCVLPACGHMPFLEMPELFNGMLGTFLAKHD